MKFRLAENKDIEKIMKIINQGKEKLKKESIDQWQNGYPNEESIERDIKNSYSYVVEEEGKILATAAISFDVEETYNEIFEGQWLSNKAYCVIHRFAVDLSSKVKKKGSKIIDLAERLCLEKNIDSIKIDTHEKNESMKNFLLNNGFKYCGVIYLEGGEKRLAYEKIIGR